MPAFNVKFEYIFRLLLYTFTQLFTYSKGIGEQIGITSLTIFKA
jgi:hypothetical protein